VGDAAPVISPAPGLVIRQRVALPAEEDLARSVELLREVASGSGHQRVLRLYAPVPTVAMSRLESRMSGFDEARAAALRLGFTPAIRPTGGRAVAYDESCLVFDFVCPDTVGVGPSDFFERTSNTIAGAMRVLGVDARVGAVAREYCPGPYSLNARGVVKLIGTSQRAIRGARLLSGMLAFGPVERFVEVLTAVNAALDLEWDPATFGTMLAEAPQVARSAVEDALARAFIAE
jgi:lipoate-protein ligase A